MTSLILFWLSVAANPVYTGHTTTGAVVAFVDEVDDDVARLVVGSAVVEVDSVLLPRGAKEGSFITIALAKKGD